MSTVNIWTRIITLENGELVLLTKGFDNENKEAAYTVEISTCFDGMIGKGTFGFTTNDEMETCFNEYSQEQAQMMWENMKSFSDGD